MAEQTTKPAAVRRQRTRAAAPAATVERARLDPARIEELTNRGVALFNAARYWHAHEAWEEVWLAAEPAEKPFFQGLIQVAAGLLHLQRRNARGARNKLAEGLAKLGPFQPVHRGIFVNELVSRAGVTLAELDEGQLPYLIPPVIRMVDR